MKLALFQADHIPQHRQQVAGGDYPEMFANLFLKLSVVVDLTVFDVTKAEYPQDIHEFDGVIISGSRASSFEKAVWIKRLEQQIHAIFTAQKPIVGICFGHQILAQAFGGRVERTSKGWGIGVNQIEVLNRKPWMRPFIRNLSLNFYHQDQVIALPEKAELIACNNFCPIQMFTLNDRILGIQAHPEMRRAHNYLLLSEGKTQLDKRYQTAVDSLRVRDHGAIVGGWIIHSFTREH